MRFLNPALLLGLLAVAIPIAIHMINRQRALKVQFPAVAFLLRSNKKLARKLKLKQLLLLAFRISIFLLLPLAMAQPYFLCGGNAQTQQDRLPSSVVLIIDDSGSMTAMDGGASLYERALEAARREIRDLRSWDEVAVVMAHDPPEILVGDLTEDRREINRAISRYEPLFGGSDVPAAMAIARDIQATSRQPNRRTVVITDDTADAWLDRTTDPSSLGGLGQVEVLSVAAADATNIAIVEISYAEADEGGVGDFRISTQIDGFGQEARTNATLFVDDVAVAAIPVEVFPEGPSNISFVHHFEGGGRFSVRVEIEDEDGVQADNTRYMNVLLDSAVQVLLVNGDVRSVSYNDELFFLEHAVSASAGEAREIEATTIAPDLLTNTSLDEYDVVVLANVGALHGPDVTRLQSFVAAGGGLWMTAGDNVDPERWNSLYGPLLPKPIRSVTVLSDPNDPDAALLATRIGNVDATHPIFRVFSLPGGESLQSVTAFQYVLLEPSADENVHIIATYGDGGPALLERTIGSGRVIFWTTSIDMDWTDLPIRTAFVPFVHRVMRYLARRGGDSRDQLVLGELAQFDIDALRAERLVVTDPTGARTVFDLENDDLEYRPAIPGYYSVEVTLGGDDVAMPGLDFTANVPPSESDVSVVSEANRLAFINAATSGETADGDVIDTPEARTTVWPSMLLILLLLFYGESLLSIRRRLWERLRDRTGGRPDLDVREV